jgi:hypothetical protein
MPSERTVAQHLRDHCRNRVRKGGVLNDSRLTEEGSCTPTRQQARGKRRNGRRLRRGPLADIPETFRLTPLLTNARTRRFHRSIGPDKCMVCPSVASDTSWAMANTVAVMYPACLWNPGAPGLDGIRTHLSS